MAFAKRIVLFLLTNILIMVMVSVVWSIASTFFGLGATRGPGGLNYGSLMVYCLIWGFVGSFLSLALSRVMAKWTMGVKVIAPGNAYGQEAALLNKVHLLAQSAGLQKMPEVGIYESPEPNAFATGPTKNRALVAVSTGLLNHMTDEEVEGVLAHEIAHVTNGDMVTMTLIQGIVNAFVLFFAKVVAFFVGQMVREENRAMVEFGVSLLAQIVFGILGSIVVASFSRWREFRADAGGASLAGRRKMVMALERLRRMSFPAEQDNSAIAAFKISNQRSGFLALFSTHPPLEQRIARLNQTAA